jgi:hypothetical protein
MKKRRDIGNLLMNCGDLSKEIYGLKIAGGGKDAHAYRPGSKMQCGQFCNFNYTDDMSQSQAGSVLSVYQSVYAKLENFCQRRVRAEGA